MPAIYQAVKQHAPQLLIRNVPVNDPETQLAQFQTDLIIDSNSFAARALGHNVLYTDSLGARVSSESSCFGRSFDA